MSNNKITMRQLQILILLSAMGTGVIVLPRRAADFLPDGAQDGWVIAIGLVIIALLVSVLISAATRVSRKAAEAVTGKESLSFIETVSVLLTKPFALILGIVMWVKLIISAGLELRIFLEISQEVMLPNTPSFIISGVMILVCGYAASKGLEARARIAEVLFALIIIPILFIFTVAVLDADFSNLQPMLVNDIHSMINGSVRLGFILTGLECLLLVSAFVPREKSLAKAVSSALLVAGIVIVFITVITIASFGTAITNEQFPVIGMMDVINLPGSFIERQEAIMFGFWIVTAFALGNALLFFSGLLVTDIFKKTKLRTGVILSGLGVFGISIIPMEREVVYAYMDFMYMTTGIFFLVVLPVALLITAKITMNGRNKILAKTAAFVIFLAFILTFLVGCFDSKEIEKRAFVVAMGVDKKDENYVVTVSIPNMNESEDDDDRIKTTEAKTIKEALQILDTKNTQSLYYGQTKLVVVGTGLLKSEEFLRGTLDTISETMKSPRRIHVLAAENPLEILKTKPPQEIVPGSYLGDIYRDKKKIGGRAFALDAERLSTNLSLTGDAVIPLIKLDEKELRLNGAVLLKDNRKTGTISKEELQGLLWCFSGGNTGAVITVDKNSMEIKNHKANIDFYENPLRAVIEVKADNLSVEFAQAIAKEISRTAEILQKKHGVDGYNLLEHLRKKNYPLYKQHADNWDDVFPKIEIIPIIL